MMRKLWAFLRQVPLTIACWMLSGYFCFFNGTFSSQSTQYAGLFGLLGFSVLLFAAVYTNFFYKKRKQIAEKP